MNHEIMMNNDTETLTILRPRFPLKLMWLISQSPGRRCGARRSCSVVLDRLDLDLKHQSSNFTNPPCRCFFAKSGIAAEILSTADSDLEANTLKIKHICRAELEFIAKESYFNLKATPQGSLLFALMKSLSSVWHGDTQLIESVNSQIRMLGQRCPRMDLLGMSSRIIIKKTMSQVAGKTSKGRAVKKWSDVRRAAGPLLQELNQSGNGYKLVLQDNSRFDPHAIKGISCKDLHPALQNVDLAKAIPDSKPTDATKFAAAQALKWKRVRETKCKQFSPAKQQTMLSVLVLQGTARGSLLTNRDDESWSELPLASYRQLDTSSAFLHVAALRTRYLLVELVMSPDLISVD